MNKTTNLSDIVLAFLFMAIMVGTILFAVNKLAEPVVLKESCDTYANYPLGYIPSRCIKQYLPELQVDIAAPQESGL